MMWLFLLELQFQVGDVKIQHSTQVNSIVYLEWVSTLDFQSTLMIRQTKQTYPPQIHSILFFYRVHED